MNGSALEETQTLSQNSNLENTHTAVVYLYKSRGEIVDIYIYIYRYIHMNNYLKQHGE